MSDHYYTERPAVESKPFQWTYTLRGHQFLFTVDQGVFSKKEVDFGSRLLIEAFMEPDVHGNILDVGCGYGPIGLALAKDFPHRTVHMIDVNERAIELAKKNKQQNGIENARIYISNLFDRVEGVFASIVTNPPIRAGKAVVHSIFEQSANYLLSGGQLWVVIQKKQGAPSALEKLKTIFDQVDVVEKKKGYFIIRAQKA
ncbi:16S rRNA (guanine1207-N2)-methyltransferase [Anoxybacillus mongoliensis]|uniref:16S rRNA (Guanine1207-N2)-methyltransferase n=1 Tax=Anoxybacillus mongoliensis TaxID=452565 RepID=A0A7W8N9E1_9BACL|nr:class I SAM-dependent methyltransferase [Anoxybacillus mongoliensis]MBB5356503.1 16S rRNA (guanine1207-N2)-methyltransferase [Anoxybacillus mongoliensis]